MLSIQMISGNRIVGREQCEHTFYIIPYWMVFVNGVAYDFSETMVAVVYLPRPYIVGASQKCPHIVE